jgi:precorrin-6A/cobalt-precorrin-6A reductase
MGASEVMARRILILGGTSEARQLARRLSVLPQYTVTVSLAGRTEAVPDHSVPLRIGGFGGAEGLAAYLRSEGIAALIDATHPYAAIISESATSAAAAAGIPLLALRRPAWQRAAGDRWSEVAGIAEAVAALGEPPRRVFLALGRKEIAPFAAAPQHFYLVRSVDPVEPPLAVPRAAYVVDRGPFTLQGDRALMLEHAIDIVVSRNSGGATSYSKIAAARALGIEVVMLRRPLLAEAPTVEHVEGVVAWLAHLGTPAARGV